MLIIRSMHAQHRCTRQMLSSTVLSVAKLTCACWQVLFLSDVLPTAWHANMMGEVHEGDIVAIWGAGPGECYLQMVMGTSNCRCQWNILVMMEEDLVEAGDMHPLAGGPSYTITCICDDISCYFTRSHELHCCHMMVCTGPIATIRKGRGTDVVCHALLCSGAAVCPNCAPPEGEEGVPH